MKPKFLLLAALLFAAPHLSAEVTLDEEAFGKTLGGWKKIKGTAAEYSLSGADYRTYKPEISPTPDGGIFISVRIDNIRGWLSNDDHASLEITVDSKGVISSAQSTVAIQGQSVKSDVIIGTSEAGKAILSPDRAVQIGTDLVANLSAKLLLQNIVEAGRVSLPAVLRHNYNRLFQAVRVDGMQVLPNVPAATVVVDPPAPGSSPAPVTTPAAAPAAPAAASTSVPAPVPSSPPAPAPATPEKPKEPGSAPLEIKSYN
ncbi:MAG: hypothetical protein V4584_02710 [Verrucomicrobiota bacterium]